MGLINTSPWTSFGNSLMQDFQTQYGNNSAVLNFLRDSLMPIINAGGQGFSNQALAQMRTGATDTVATQYQNAQKALQNRQAVTGDVNLPSGVNEQNNAALAAAGANAQAKAQQDITLANEEQRQKSFWNAEDTLMGVAKEYNPLGYAGAANSAGDTAANIETANANMMKAQQGGFMHQLGSAAIGLGTSALTGGLSSMANGGGFLKGAANNMQALYGHE